MLVEWLAGREPYCAEATHVCEGQVWAMVGVGSWSRDRVKRRKGFVAGEVFMLRRVLFVSCFGLPCKKIQVIYIYLIRFHMYVHCIHILKIH